MKTIYKIKPKSKNKNNNQTPGTRGEVIVSITHSLVVERSYFYSYYNYNGCFATHTWVTHPTGWKPDPNGGRVRAEHAAY